MDRFKENVLPGSFKRSTCLSQNGEGRSKMQNVTELKAISREFADQYLLKGKNFLHDVKIYHFGEPKNFSFTPSQAWLQNFRKNSVEPFNDNKVDQFMKSDDESSFENGFSRRNNVHQSTSRTSKETFRNHTMTKAEKRHSNPLTTSNIDTKLRNDESSILLMRHRRSIGDDDDIDEEIDDNDYYLTVIKSTIPSNPEGMIEIKIESTYL